MRIVQLGPYPPPHGGVQNNLVAIHRFLKNRGIPAQVINITRFRKDGENGIYYPENWLELLLLLFRLRYDIVHLHIGGNVTARLLALSFACCMIPRRKAVMTFHSGGYPDSKEGKTARHSSLRGFIFRRFDRVITVNKSIEKMFIRFGLKSENVRLIPPHALTDMQVNHPLPDDLASFFKAHHPVLMTVGLLEPEYDLSLQIEALGLLRKKFPDAGLVIVGAGSLEKDLIREIDDKPYSNDILLYGDMPHHTTLTAMKACTLFLRTTLFDGDSIAVREALHIGVPVIATDTGMRPPGLHLIPFSDVSRLVQAVEEELECPTPSCRQDEASEENLEAVLKVYQELA